MAYIYNKIMNFIPFRGKNEHKVYRKQKAINKSVLTSWLGNHESYSILIQSILLWEDPVKSTISLCLLNLLIWLIAWSDVSLITICSIVMLLSFWRQQWLYKIWPEIRLPPEHPEDTEDWTPLHPSAVQAPELSSQVDAFMLHIVDFFRFAMEARRLRPIVFMCCVDIMLMGTFIIGNVLPGVLLLNITVIFIFVFSRLHVICPEFIRECYLFFKQIFSQNGTAEGNIDNYIAEFIPEDRSLEAQAALLVPLISRDVTTQEAGMEQPQSQDSSIRERRSTSNISPADPADANATAYFTEGLPTDFPSYDNDSVDNLDGPDIDIPDAMPSLTQDSLAYSPPNPATHADIKFISSHFGGSSDEEEFSLGLAFKQSEQARSEMRDSIDSIRSSSSMQSINNMIAASITSNLASNAIALGQNFLGSVIGYSPYNQMSTSGEQRSERVRAPPGHYDEETTSELEDDFEVISEDDLH